MNQFSRFNALFIRFPWLEFVRFAIVGCLNVFVSSFIFYATYTRFDLGQLIIDNSGIFGQSIEETLVVFGVRSVDAGAASAVGYLGGMISSFVLNRTWTFRVEELSVRQIWRFLAVNLVGLILSAAMMFVLVDVMGGFYIKMWLVTIIFTTILNYVGNKFWTFAKQYPV